MNKQIPVGLCQCGCGRKTKVATRTDNNSGRVKGRPSRYLPGHWGRGRKLNRPIIARRVHSQGYILVHKPDHPRAHRTSGRVYEHILVAEAALGGPLPKGAEVHHVNNDPSDNRPENLVICPDRAYHKLLHQRQRALEESGHADWKRCQFCGEWDDPKNDMWVHATRSGAAHHRGCVRAHYRRLKNAS